MLNNVNLMGRMTRDPEISHTPSGVPVTSFSLAVERDFATKDGGEKEVDFFDCVAWRNTAEFITKYLIKGRMVAVSGRLQNRTWTDKAGNKRKVTEIVVENVYFADSKKETESPAAPNAIANKTGNAPTPFQPIFPDAIDVDSFGMGSEDLPF